MSEKIPEDIILEKDAFETDNVVSSVRPPPPQYRPILGLAPVKVDRPVQIEMGNALDGIIIPESFVQIAKTNQLDISWEKLQQLLNSLINEQYILMEDKYQDEPTKKMVEALLINISHRVNDRSNCPFTIQRLCELVIDPTKNYQMYIKYLRAVEKVLTVVSSWEDYYARNKSDNCNQHQQATEQQQFLPSFSVEFEPHNFQYNTNEYEVEEDNMEDVALSTTTMRTFSQ